MAAILEDHGSPPCQPAYLPPQWEEMGSKQRHVRFLSACQAGNLQFVEQALAVQGPASINPRWKRSVCFREACSYGRLEVVRRLLEWEVDGEGVDVDAGLGSALESALRHGHVDVAAELMALPLARRPNVTLVCLPILRSDKMHCSSPLLAAAQFLADRKGASRCMEAMLAALPEPYETPWTRWGRSTSDYIRLTARMLLLASMGQYRGKIKALEIMLKPGWQEQRKPALVACWQAVLQGKLPTLLGQFIPLALQQHPLAAALSHSSSSPPKGFALILSQQGEARVPTRTLGRFRAFGAHSLFYIFTCNGQLPTRFMCPESVAVQVALFLRHRVFAWCWSRIRTAHPWLPAVQLIHERVDWGIDEPSLQMVEGHDVAAGPGVAEEGGAWLHDFQIAPPSVLSMKLGLLLSLPPPQVWCFNRYPHADAEPQAAYAAALSRLHPNLWPQMVAVRPSLTDARKQGNWAIRRHMVLCRRSFVAT